MSYLDVNRALRIVALVAFFLALYTIYAEPWNKDLRIVVYVVAGIVNAVSFAFEIWTRKRWEAEGNDEIDV